ncbi:hypothetical protein ABK040_001455 [Willaertia magna]
MSIQPATLKSLSNTPVNTQQGGSGNKKVRIPVKRLCPHCLSLQVHDGLRCRGGNCVACGKYFCFYCLGVKDGKKISCQDGYTPCVGKSVPFPIQNNSNITQWKVD